MTWTKELDEAAVLATRKGYWHVVLFYLLCGLASFPTSFLVFSQIFTNATPEHWCSPPPELDALDLSEDLLRNLTVPGEQGSYESCKAYSIDPIELHSALKEYVIERSITIREAGTIKVIKISQLMPANDSEDRKIQIDRVRAAILSIRGNETTCTNGWTFNTEHYKRTMVTEFSLVCDKDYLPTFSNTLFWVGSIFGNLLFGWMSDRYGRRPTILLMIFLEVPIAIAASFATSYWNYIVLRVVGGCFFPALYQLPFILALELMPPKIRTYAGIVVGMLFATGMCLLSALAYALRDWYVLSLASSLPFVLLYGYYWLIPESPRWLVGRGRIGAAEKVLRNLAKKNGIDLRRGFLLDLHKKIKEENAEAEVAMLPNGHVTTHTEKDKEELERRISNMLTFKPDLTNIAEDDKTEALETVLALEVADIVNKGPKLKLDNIDLDVESFEGDADTRDKATQTDLKFSTNTLRRKSIQLVNRLLNQDDDVENLKFDDQNSEGDCKASPLDLFRYPNIRKKFILLTFNWVALGVVYNGLSYNTPNFGVDDYLAFFIGGAVELPSYIIAWRCMDRYGRRWVLCLFMCVGGVACLSCVLVPEAWPWATVGLAMCGRLCAAASFAVFYVQVGEVVPTVARAQAMAAASLFAGLGLLACPHLVRLAVYSRTLPLVIMGVLCIMGGVSSLFLPETLNQPLPQTLGDGEMFGRDFKLLSCVGETK